MSESPNLAIFTTSAPCSYNRGHTLTIFDLSLMHSGGHVLIQSAVGTNSDNTSILTLHHGSITGLVGTNGAGKSSLAQVLASKTLDGFPTDQLTVEYLAAADDEDGHSEEASTKNARKEDDTVGSLESYPREYIQSRIQARLQEIRHTMEQLEQRLVMDDADPAATTITTVSLEETAEQLAALCDVEEAMVETMERETDQAMERVGLKAHAHKTLAQLSCGWRYKCRLIAATLSHPQCLIVDEPNFLDTNSTEWLIERLQHMTRRDNAMVLLISHKEALLERLCDRIWYVNSANQSLTAYHGSYSNFRSTLELEFQQATKTLEDTNDKFQVAEQSLKKIQNVLVKREQNMHTRRLEMLTDKRWIKGKNKEAKQKADRSAASKLKKAQHAVDVAQELKQKAKRERVRPLEFHGLPVAQEVVVSLQSVGFRYKNMDDHGENDEIKAEEEEEWLFQNVDAVLEAKDRVLLQGPNGCGKSTLVRLILGILEAGEGSIQRTTQNVLYFPQTALHELLRQHGHQTAVEFLLHSGEDDDGYDHDGGAAPINRTETQLRKHLGELGLVKDLALQRVATLSAGQRVRLWLAKELLQHPKPALLILDELSENVDRETRQSLVDMLQTFEGAVLVISHDADFGASFHHVKTWNLCRHGMEVRYID